MMITAIIADAWYLLSSMMGKLCLHHFSYAHHPMRFYFHFIARDMEGDINLMRKEKNYLEHELNTQPNGQRKK